MKYTIIYHSADLDGILCREIAKKCLKNDELEFIGWNFGDPVVPVPADGHIFVMDLPIDRVFGLNFNECGHLPFLERVIWIDHHASAIETHPATIAGYRIDGVSACRLAWQFFIFATRFPTGMFQVLGGIPDLLKYKNRVVTEPLIVMLAGEYDIFDKRWRKEDPRVDLLQLGRHTQEVDYQFLLGDGNGQSIRPDEAVETLCQNGKVIQFYRRNEYADVIKGQGFDVDFRGISFLACCSHECDIRSQLFDGAIKDRHEALLGFTYTGNPKEPWRVSMYQIPGKEHIDILAIAKSFPGGGGHKGACGFTTTGLLFICNEF